MSQTVDDSPAQPPSPSQPSSVTVSMAVTASESARQRRKIAALEEKLQVLEAGHATKQRRCETDSEDVTIDQDHLQTGYGYATLSNNILWLNERASELEHDDYVQMLKKLRQGADSARGDDTSKLKNLVPDWINREFKPNPLVNREDKNCHGFVHDACGRLLCPTELDWQNPVVKTGIWDCVDGYIVTEMSWPTFLYEKYIADQNDLEQGLFKSALLLQAFKAIFTSPSSAKDVDGKGDGANIIENNRCARRDTSGRKVKTHVAQIIKMHKVLPRSITYVACQRNVKQLLTWWTRKIFGTSHHADISDATVSNMSVNALARQRAQ
ncbi:hypothetical protein EV702DRAFT_1046059 [Suillus placidus]|uniref:Uncharacterized protein n=1 Tax=Suillus placidus TaxID=48579 RepID=A0A9P6ZTZ3_9AGAM|nr:hypothetical protein EV702DRAFT_1046059 [Suillus placidus]